jgi:phytoene desaturase
MVNFVVGFTLFRESFYQFYPLMAKPGSVAIIGAGIGGVSAAIRLANNGFRVTVYEKNGAPGGRVSQTVRDGHRFDLGATIFLMPEVYKETFRSMGLNLEEMIEFLPMTTLYNLFFDDGTVLDFTTDKRKMESQLEAIEPGSYPKMLSYLESGYGFLQLGLKKLLGRNFLHWFDFIHPGNVLLLIRLKTYIRHQTYVKRFFRHPHLQMAFTFQNIYVGQTPYEAPALFSMLPAAELLEGSMFPKGGMNRILEALVEHAVSLGVEFVCNKPVEKILTDGKRATGLRFEDGSAIYADIIVANADLPYVYRELLPDSRRAARIGRLRHACSAIVLHWGVDKVYPGLAQHNVFLADNYKECLDTIFKEKSLSEEFCFYVHSPVRTDPSAAPEGQDSLSVVIPVGHMDESKNQDWQEIRAMARRGVIRRLSQLGWENLEDHIKFEICYLPGTWESMFHVNRGATFGSLGHNIMQMGYFRPHNRHKKYGNLYFTGGSTHPGNGIPLVLLSSKLTTERILNDHSV